ncbi:MAG TPA: S9 family peptidase [Gemmatimonadales bacterium]|nr:S9 family peptidase [Gemmatimonadales bacterium]
MRVLSVVTLALLAVAPSRRLAAQVPQYPDSVRAAVHRIFASRDFAPQRFGPARFIEGGAAYTTVERAASGGGVDIVRYETATGARSVLVPASAMRPAGDSTSLAFDDYGWSADGGKLLLFTNTERVWRNNTRGDYWVLTLATGKLMKLGGDAPVSSLMYAKFSPDGGRVAYVSKGDLYVQQLADGRITRLTTGADSLHVNGMSDWVYEEEFGLRDGFRWSPDGQRIAYWNFDMSGVRTFTLINYTDSLYPILTPIQYPKTGTPNSAVRVGVVSASGGATTWLQVAGDPRDNYIPWMEWAGPREVMIQHFNRLQNTDDLLLADAATGVTRTVLSERDSAWVDLVDDVPWLDGGRRFLWTSEADGWRHVYAVSRDGRTRKLLTPGAFDVVNVVGVDSAQGWLYYMASPDNATQRYLYRSKLDGSGRPVRVSPAAQAGTHRYTLSPNGQWAFHTFTAFDLVPTTDLVRLPTHTTARVLVQNDRLRQAVAPFLTRPVEFFKVPVAGGVTVDGWMIRPRDFDSTKTYPMLVYVYGEPAGQTTNDSWMGGSALWYRTIADQGYLVASFDNSGTPAPRGRAWRKVIYGAVGVLSSQQQADAVQYLARNRHYVDSTRVAIWGWSGGGSSTLQAMFRYPKVYQVGMSVAPVPDQRLYDNIYQERYMGLPDQNAEGYRTASPINHAEGLAGHLLLVHGSGDDNVHFQGSQRMINRLVQLQKPFEFMEYPNRSHCICEGQGTTEHVYQLLTRYLMEHLPAGGR